MSEQNKNEKPIEKELQKAQEKEKSGDSPSLEDRLKAAEAKKAPVVAENEDLTFLKTQALKGLMSDLPEERRVEIKKLIDESGMNFKQQIAMIEMAKTLTKPTKPPAEKPTGGVPQAAVAGIEKHFNVLDFQRERDEKRKAKT